MAIAIHPYISSVPHHIGYLEPVFDNVAGLQGVVHINGAEMVEWVTV